MQRWNCSAYQHHPCRAVFGRRHTSAVETTGGLVPTDARKLKWTSASCRAGRVCQDALLPPCPPLPPQLQRHQQQRRRMHEQVEDIERAYQCALQEKAQLLDQMGLGRDRRDRHPGRQRQQPDPPESVEPPQHGCALENRRQPGQQTACRPNRNPKFKDIPARRSPRLERPTGVCAAGSRILWALTTFGLQAS